MSAIAEAAAVGALPTPDAIANELQSCVSAWSSFVPSTVVEDVLLGYEHNGPLRRDMQGVIM